MNRRAALVLGGPALMALGMGLAYREGVPARRRPPRNLILISIDTLRADHLGCYGYERPTSPHLDSYAADGTLFANVTTGSSWTVPAHMSLLTGVEPIAHGLINYPNAGLLGAGYVTLAETFRRAGFRTAAFTGGGFVSARHGFDIGFQTFEHYGRRFEDNMPAVNDWVDALPPGERFFLFLHGFNVHKLYKPPPPFDRLFAGDYTGDYDTADFQPENPRPSPEDLEYVISQYDGEIAYVDRLLGEFLEGLEARGLLKDTLVVVTSDHGEEMYEHGMVDHIHSLYDELTLVPLIMFGPNVPKRVVREHFAQLDLYPTLCELMDVPLLAPMQAVSRAELLARGHREVPRATGFYDDPVYSFTGFSEYPYHVSSVRTSRWKLQVWSLAGMKDVNWPTSSDRPRYTYKFRPETEDFVELFDLQNDPGERHDVKDRYPEVVQQLARMLKDRTAESRSFARAPENAPEPDLEYLGTLKALGYVRDSSPSTSPAEEPGESSASGEPKNP